MKAVIFDMDGLMLDTEYLSVLAFDYAGEKIGIGPAGYMNDRMIGLTWEATQPIWVAQFGDRYKADEFKQYRNEFFARYFEEKGVPVKPGLLELLDFLKERGYKLAVASSSSTKSVMSQLQAIDVYKYFSAIITGDMVKRSKPAPDIYKLACEAVGEDPIDCVALEDGKNGILSAHSAGCRVIMVPDMLQPDDEVKKLVVSIEESLFGVIEYFRKHP